MDVSTLARIVFDPNRLRIIALLQDGPMFVNAIAQATGLQAPTTSQHLRILREAGLVTTRRQGTSIEYGLAESHEASLAAAISGVTKLARAMPCAPQIVAA
ncbi:MAG: winged helix-turn-helix transcriptional regulator [Chloroflexi bacterium]|nr:winged helix-turn-helix transcriptional regulator [Chloroflexota bacterium]